MKLSDVNRATKSVARLVSCMAVAVIALTTTISNAMADGALEWRKGGMFANIANPKAKRKLPSKVTRRIKKTNIGGIRRKSRKSRRLRKRAKSRITSRRARSSRIRKTKRTRRVRVASLGNSFKYAVRKKKIQSKPKLKSITGGGGVTWVARSSCLTGRLKSAIYHVAKNYGRVRVNSTCRGRKKNRRVGGAKRSWHLSGRAADIRVWGNVRGASRYLRRIAGGYKNYGGGLFHIDTGPRRSW